ncbi:MAG: SH3 domain-containing protein [Anaerolineae bacterium]
MKRFSHVRIIAALLTLLGLAGCMPSFLTQGGTTSVTPAASRVALAPTSALPAAPTLPPTPTPLPTSPPAPTAPPSPTVAPPTAAPTMTPTPPPLSPDVKFITTVDEVVIRDGPGPDYTRIGQVAAGQLVKVTGVSPDRRWWRVMCANETPGNCWMSGDPSLTKPAPPPSGPTPAPIAGEVQPTDVKFVMALDNVVIRGGPAERAPKIGVVYEGQIAKVTGVSADKQWWRVICPDDSAGDCWMAADPALTKPTLPPR